MMLTSSAMQSSRLSPAQAAQHLLNRRRARTSTVDFAGYIEVPGRPVSDDPECELFHPVETNLATHQRLICEALDEVSRTPNGRLMVLAPPGSAKSTYVSVVFPARYLGAEGGRRVIMTSYGSDLAIKMGRRTRAVIRQPRYSAIFGTTISPDSKAADRFSLTNGSEYMATGIMASVMGNRCFVGSTLICTKSGIKRIDAVTHNDVVLGYDHINSAPVWRKVRATRMLRRSGLLRIRTKSAREIVCTADHPIFVQGRGYTAAEILRAGDPLLCIDLSWMRRAERGVGEAMHEVLQPVSQGERQHSMRVLRQGRDTRYVALEKTRKERNFARLLRQVLPDAIAESIAQEAEAAKKAITSSASRLSLQGLRNAISPDISPDGLLFSKLRERTAFAKNDRTWQFPLQGWIELLSLVRFDEAIDFRAGQPEMRGLRQQEALACPSYRRESKEQSSRESCDFVPVMPYEAPQERDTVTMVEQLCGDELPVYDIEVEGTHNFFANEILAHNCEGLLIDDPFRNRMEAESQTIRDNIWDAYENDLTTRLVPGAWIAMVMTRWHHDDIAGRILPADWDAESGYFTCRDGMTWRVLCFQAECEKRSDPLGRPLGAMFWPQWFGPDHWPAHRKNTYKWASLFQQRPRPLEGGFFTEGMLLIDGEPVEAPPRVDMVYAVMDTAMKTGKRRDGTAVVFFAYARRREADEPQLYVLDWHVTQVSAALLIEMMPWVLQRLNELAAEHHTPDTAVFIEDKNSGTVLLQQMETQTAQRVAEGLPYIGVFPIKAYLSAKGKNERAVAASLYIHSGDVKLTPRARDLTVEFHDVTRNHLVHQFTQFDVNEPDQEEDDLLDCLAYGTIIALDEGYQRHD